MGAAFIVYNDALIMIGGETGETKSRLPAYLTAAVVLASVVALLLFAVLGGGDATPSSVEDGTRDAETAIPTPTMERVAPPRPELNAESSTWASTGPVGLDEVEEGLAIEREWVEPGLQFGPTFTIVNFDLLVVLATGGGLDGRAVEWAVRDSTGEIVWQEVEPLAVADGSSLGYAVASPAGVEGVPPYEIEYSLSDGAGGFRELRLVENPRYERVNVPRSEPEVDEIRSTGRPRPGCWPKAA